VVIGRADETDVRIVDPRVSRVHAELHYSPEGWILVSRGRNGVLMDGVQVTDVQLNDRVPFQLGPGGPQLRFRVNGLSSASSATLDNVDTSLLKMLQIDQQKRDEEVRGITEGALFQQLKKRAGELRKRWQTGDTDLTDRAQG